MRSSPTATSSPPSSAVRGWPPTPRPWWGRPGLRRAVRTAAVLACLGAVAGLLLAFYLTFVCSYASLSAANLLVFLLMWLVPTPLIAGMVNKYWNKRGSVRLDGASFVNNM